MTWFEPIYQVYLANYSSYERQSQILTKITNPILCTVPHLVIPSLINFYSIVVGRCASPWARAPGTCPIPCIYSWLSPRKVLHPGNPPVSLGSLFIPSLVRGLGRPSTVSPEIMLRLMTLSFKSSRGIMIY
jgi:hypothetical protein